MYDLAFKAELHKISFVNIILVTKLPYYKIVISPFMKKLCVFDPIFLHILLLPNILRIVHIKKSCNVKF